MCNYISPSTPATPKWPGDAIYIAHKLGVAVGQLRRRFNRWYCVGSIGHSQAETIRWPLWHFCSWVLKPSVKQMLGYRLNWSHWTYHIAVALHFFCWRYCTDAMLRGPSVQPVLKALLLCAWHTLWAIVRRFHRCPSAHRWFNRWYCLLQLTSKEPCPMHQCLFVG